MSATLAAAQPAVAASAEIRSADGVALPVRPMASTDGAALATAVAMLSPESRYLRFLSPKPGLTGREIAALVDLDHHAREALVAIDPATGAWAGVARYVALPEDPLSADVAVTVADAWQGRGVGTALFALLVERARREGIAQLRATTLAANRPAVRLLRRRGLRVIGQDGGVLELVCELRPAATCPCRR